MGHWEKKKTPPPKAKKTRWGKGNSKLQGKNPSKDEGHLQEKTEEEGKSVNLHLKLTENILRKGGETRGSQER